MAVTARLWSAGELNTASKMNTIRADILELDAVAGFEDGQSKTITIGDGNASNTGSISAVSDRAILSHLGVTCAAGAGPDDLNVRLALTNATTITATRSGTTDDVTVSVRVNDPRG